MLSRPPPPRFLILALDPARDGRHKLAVTILHLGDGRQRTIRFGALGYDDFTTHKDPARRSRYVRRHRAKENWSDPMTAGFWAYHLLWRFTDMNVALARVMNEFHMDKL